MLPEPKHLELIGFARHMIRYQKLSDNFKVIVDDLLDSLYRAVDDDDIHLDELLSILFTLDDALSGEHP